MRVAWTAHVPNTIPPQVIQPYQEGATLHRVDLLSGGGVATGFAWVEFGYRPGTSFGGGNPGPYYRWNIGGGFHEIYPSSPSHRFEVIIQLGPVKVSTPSPSGPIETREFGSFLFVDGVLQDSYRADTLYDAILRQHFCNAAVSVKQFAGVIPPVYPFPNPARISAMKYSVE